MSIEKGARKPRDRSDLQETLKIRDCRPAFSREAQIARHLLPSDDGFIRQSLADAAVCGCGVIQTS
jgi:hypothetical protein